MRLCVRATDGRWGSSAEAKLNNFLRLEPLLRQLGIAVDVNLVRGRSV